MKLGVVIGLCGEFTQNWGESTWVSTTIYWLCNGTSLFVPLPLKKRGLLCLRTLVYCLCQSNIGSVGTFNVLWTLIPDMWSLAGCQHFGRAFSCGWQSYKWLLQMMASEDFDMMQLFEEENGSINSHRQEIFAHHFSSSSAACFPTNQKIHHSI